MKGFGTTISFVETNGTRNKIQSCPASKHNDSGFSVEIDFLRADLVEFCRF
jgi:hypothetical protein|tara:strand:+ start:1193 stop:1345 length:153 start_codon:yes stop_codon:yes gene_type:complete